MPASSQCNAAQAVLVFYIFGRQDKVANDISGYHTTAKGVTVGNRRAALCGPRCLAPAPAVVQRGWLFRRHSWIVVGLLARRFCAPLGVGDARPRGGRCLGDWQGVPHYAAHPVAVPAEVQAQQCGPRF